MLNRVMSAEMAKHLTTIDRSAVTADGEIIDPRPDVPFRSISNLKAYDDAQRFYKPSLTDPTLYESLEDIFKRCQRGELVAQKRGTYAPSDVADDDIEFNDIEDLTDIDDMAENLVAEAEQKKEQVSPTSPDATATGAKQSNGEASVAEASRSKADEKDLSA